MAKQKKEQEADSTTPNIITPVNFGRKSFNKELDSLVKQIESAFGANTIYQPSKHSPISTMERISTGNPQLDYDLGGGIPTGRIILVTGPFSTGKTYFTTKCAAQVTSLGGRIGVIDEERTWDKEWAGKCGVDPELCWVGSGEYSEKSMDLAEVMVSSGEFDTLIVDSLAAMVPKKVRDEAHEDHQMGVEAKLNAKFFRKILAAQDTLERKGHRAPTVFVINQIRKKIGIAYGNPEVLPGGEAQMYYASIWMDFRASEAILDKDENVVGMYFNYNIKKNKTAPPRRTGTVGMFNQNYGGMMAGDWDFPGAVMDLAVNLGLLVKDGKWYKSALLDKSYMYAQLWNKLRVEKSLERKLIDAVNALPLPTKVTYQPRQGLDGTPEEVVEQLLEEETTEETAQEKSVKKGKGKKK